MHEVGLAGSFFAALPQQVKTTNQNVIFPTYTSMANTKVPIESQAWT